MWKASKRIIFYTEVHFMMLQFCGVKDCYGIVKDVCLWINPLYA